MAFTFVVAPAGVSAAGIFAPAVFVDPALPPALLADDIAHGSAFVEDGDFASLLTFVHPVDAAVKTQFRLKRGSGAAVLEDGQELEKIKKVGDQTDRQIQDEYRRILQTLVNRGDIKILTIQTEVGVDAEDFAAGFVEYQNLRTGKKEKLPL